MSTVLQTPGVNPIAVNKYINIDIQMLQLLVQLGFVSSSMVHAILGKHERRTWSCVISVH